MDHWITQTEARILDLFRKRPASDYSISEIAAALETGSYAWTFNAIKRLERAGIVSTKQRGHLKLVRINLSSPLTVEYLSLLDLHEAQKARAPGVPMPESVGGEYFTLLYFDRSFHVVMPECGKAEDFSGIKAKIMKASEFVTLMRGPRGREIAGKRLIFHGAGAYYSMLKEAMGAWGMKGGDGH